jgi:hypothetical protein
MTFDTTALNRQSSSVPTFSADSNVYCGQSVQCAVRFVVPTPAICRTTMNVPRAYDQIPVRKADGGVNPFTDICS